jgi:hypothetical protein
MMFNKFALTLLGMIAVAAALPTIDFVVKRRGSDLDLRGCNDQPE